MYVRNKINSRYKVVGMLFMVCIFVVPRACIAKQKTFVLWQLPTQGGGQMNSYVIKTVSGKIIVIDGGFEKDAEYLKSFLAPLGNHVDMWFISHQHVDHVGALTAILNKPGELSIDKIYASMLDSKWIEANENDNLSTTVDLNKALQKANKQVNELTLGQVIDIDGVTIEILGIKNPEIHDGINNSSVVMKISDKHKSVLFTGDIGVEASQKLLYGPYANRLKSDYVQMSHHGQNGATEEFYIATSPKYCIWPTPRWLWDNDNGNGPGTGPWKTQEVRRWMKKLNVKKHYVLFDGLICIE